MALVDAEYRFLYVEVGCNGRISDGGVFTSSLLYRALENNFLNIPNKTALPGRNMPVPYTILADDAFPLKEYLMKPYSRNDLFDISKRIFNYRLSRARRTVENAFGILSNRFRILQKPIHLCPEKVDKIVLACCCLHNFLIDHRSADKRYKQICLENINETNGFFKFHQQGSNTHSLQSNLIRQEFAKYFTNEGNVDWQWAMI